MRALAAILLVLVAIPAAAELQECRTKPYTTEEWQYDALAGAAKQYGSKRVRAFIHTKQAHQLPGGIDVEVVELTPDGRARLRQLDQPGYIWTNKHAIECE